MLDKVKRIYGIAPIPKTWEVVGVCENIGSQTYGVVFRTSVGRYLLGVAGSVKCIDARTAKKIIAKEYLK